MTACVVLLLVKAALSGVTGICILTSAADGVSISVVVEEGASLSAGAEEALTTCFSAKRVSMCPVVGASLFHSEAVVAGASGGGAPTLPV